MCGRVPLWGQEQSADSTKEALKTFCDFICSHRWSSHCWKLLPFGRCDAVERPLLGICWASVPSPFLLNFPETFLSLFQIFVYLLFCTSVYIFWTWKLSINTDSLWFYCVTVVLFCFCFLKFVPALPICFNTSKTKRKENMSFIYLFHKLNILPQTVVCYQGDDFESIKELFPCLAT
jgi:hypothetical protein